MAGTITSALVIADREKTLNNSQNIEVTISFVADAADGGIPTLALTDYSGWYITKMIWVPGVAPTGVAPTDLTDLTLPDGDGIDVLDGAGLNLPAVGAKEEVMTRIIPAAGFTVTLVQPAAATNSATGRIKLFLDR